MSLSKTLPHRDWIAIIFSLGGMTLLSWFYLVNMASDMSISSSISVMQSPVWNADYFWMMFLMWSIMMIGMMLPSVTPMVMLFVSVAKKSAEDKMPIASTAAFVSGYIAIWLVFSLVATIAQWGLNKAVLLSPMMTINNDSLVVALLIFTGLYQWSSIKNKCLEQCRSPVYFISTHWKPGTLGAFKMGLSHGSFCLGCCWMLMGLLFVGGVMNLLWIAVISLFVLVEKVLSVGESSGRVLGLMLIIAGGIIAII